MVNFEDFKYECYKKDSQISLQTIEILYYKLIAEIQKPANDPINNNLDIKPKTKKTTKK